MLLAPGKGFVFLAATKCGSTSIETAFMPHSQIILQNPPNIKHTTYAGFQRFLQPFLASAGFPRESYEVVCAFREPIDWLSSWWRYRSREKLANPTDPRHRNYTGEVSFEEFARAYMEGSEQFAKVGRQSKFVRPRPGEAGGALLSVFCLPVWAGASVDLPRLGAQPDLLLQLVVFARFDALCAKVGWGHGADSGGGAGAA